MAVNLIQGLYIIQHKTFPVPDSSRYQLFFHFPVGGQRKGFNIDGSDSWTNDIGKHVTYGRQGVTLNLGGKLYLVVMLFLYLLLDYYIKLSVNKKDG